MTKKDKNLGDYIDDGFKWLWGQGDDKAKPQGAAPGAPQASGFGGIANDYGRQRVVNMQQRQRSLEQQLKLFAPINEMLKAMYGPDAGFDLSVLANPPSAAGLGPIHGQTDQPQGATDTPNGELPGAAGGLGYGPASGQQLRDQGWHQNEKGQWVGPGGK